MLSITYGKKERKKVRLRFHNIYIYIYIYIFTIISSYLHLLTLQHLLELGLETETTPILFRYISSQSEVYGVRHITFKFISYEPSLHNQPWTKRLARAEYPIEGF